MCLELYIEMLRAQGFISMATDLQRELGIIQACIAVPPSLEQEHDSWQTFAPVATMVGGPARGICPVGNAR